DRFFEPFFEPPFFEPFFELFLEGTFPPASRASDRPIAIACFLLVTFLPERPLFNSRRFISCMAFSTFSPAFLPYLAINLLPPWTVIVFQSQIIRILNPDLNLNLLPARGGDAAGWISTFPFN